VSVDKSRLAGLALLLGIVARLVGDGTNGTLSTVLLVASLVLFVTACLTLGWVLFDRRRER